MKGGKNMLYFYCCDVKVRGAKVGKAYGCIEYKRNVETVAETQQVWDEIKKTLAPKYHISFLADITLEFTAFNPL